MKKLTNFLLLALLLFLWLPLAAQAGQTINFDGDPSLLANDPVFNAPNSLFPANSPSYNRVTVSGGTVGGYVYGGYSQNGNPTGNTVTVSGGTVVMGVYGGLGTNGNATGNTVTVSGGSVGRGMFTAGTAIPARPRATRSFFLVPPPFGSQIPS